jgi:hypothetical protein
LKNVQVGDREQFELLVEKWSEDPCIPTSTAGTDDNVDSAIKERDGQFDAPFEWDRIDFSKTGLCGGYKCYFTDSKYDSVGYLVSRNVLEDDKEWGSEFDDGWKVGHDHQVLIFYHSICTFVLVILLKLIEMPTLNPCCAFLIDFSIP